MLEVNPPINMDTQDHINIEGKDIEIGYLKQMRNAVRSDLGTSGQELFDAMIRDLTSNKAEMNENERTFLKNRSQYLDEIHDILGSTSDISDKTLADKIRKLKESAEFNATGHAAVSAMNSLREILNLPDNSSNDDVAWKVKQNSFELQKNVGYRIESTEEVTKLESEVELHKSTIDRLQKEIVLLSEVNTPVESTETALLRIQNGKLKEIINKLTEMLLSVL